ncbi:GSCOCT00014212001.2-RA-CDS [Cotesia congregata]|uniref:Cc_RNAseT2.2_25.4 n=2 Tax=root TaxID=1 RepID=S6D9I1_COTCN|nr:ribonuclease T2 [Bracoviriform congregatae]CAD6243319.1 GSCOCT00014212001.2-RA-CDS [Cotesia congregata]CAG17488.1 ribonuclease T2 [Bracoviriform congregatae]CAG5092330.1 cc_RNAseT2.2_25.4 [Cotesia congregata]CCQ71081.1 hypothetical ribonuclease RNAseT2-like2 [Cotesia congregata]
MDHSRPWPTMFQREADPMPGCRRFDIFLNKNRFVDHKILGALDNTWYTILAKEWSENTKFWEHEFNKHGSCATRSSVIGDDVNYFKRTLELHRQLNIGMTFSLGGLKTGATIKLRYIIDIIEKKVGATVKIDFVQNPYTGENYITELYICYDTHLRVMDCPNVYWSNEKLETDIRYLDQLPRA